MQAFTTYLGADVAAAVKTHLGAAGADGRVVGVVECDPHPRPVFLRDGQATEFHVRIGNTTRLLDIEEANAFIASRW